MPGDRGQAEFIIILSFFRTSQVRDQDNGGRRGKQTLQGGQTGTDARVVLNDAAAYGHIEIGAYQDSLVCRIKVIQGNEPNAHCYPAFIRAMVVSSMRLENPHSLSYQATTFTVVPSMTLVSEAS